MPLPAGGLPAVQPQKGHEKALGKIQKEATKAGLTVLGASVHQLSEQVSTGESLTESLKVRYLGGGSFRVDTLQLVKLSDGQSSLSLVVQWSGGTKLSHEMVSVVPGALSSSLKVVRGLMGSWGAGRWAGSAGGEDDPLAQEASSNPELFEGIEWNWEKGEVVMKLDWGLQAVPLDPTKTLHVVHTAPRGVVAKNVGLAWYVKRRNAFAVFVAAHPTVQNVPAPSFDPPPYALLLLDQILG